MTNSIDNIIDATVETLMSEVILACALLMTAVEALEAGEDTTWANTTLKGFKALVDGNNPLAEITLQHMRRVDESCFNRVEAALATF